MATQEPPPSAVSTIIRSDEVYRLDVFLLRLGIARWKLNEARRNGLRVIKAGDQRYIRGVDWQAYLGKVSDQPPLPPPQQDHLCGPTCDGATRLGEIYHLDGFRRRVRMSKGAYRSAVRNGLRAIETANRVYIRGSDWDAYLLKVAEEPSEWDAYFLRAGRGPIG